MQSYSSQDDLAAAVAELSRRDAATCGLLAARHGVPPLRRMEPGLASLLRIVTDQLISLKAAAAIWQRLEAGLPMGDANSLAAASEDRLRGFGLSAARRAASRPSRKPSLQARSTSRTLGCLTTLPCCKRLQSIPGIGPWTAQIYLLIGAEPERRLAGGGPCPAAGRPGPFRPPGPAQPCRHARDWRRPGGPGGRLPPTCCGATIATCAELPRTDPRGMEALHRGVTPDIVLIQVNKPTR